MEKSFLCHFLAGIAVRLCLFSGGLNRAACSNLFPKDTTPGPLMFLSEDTHTIWDCHSVGVCFFGDFRSEASLLEK